MSSTSAARRRGCVEGGVHLHVAVAVKDHDHDHDHDSTVSHPERNDRR